MLSKWVEHKVIVAVAVAALAVLGTALAVVVRGDDAAETTPTTGALATARFRLSTRTAAPGSRLFASGTGWEPGELVIFRYGPRNIGEALTAGNGSFSRAPLQVPADATAADGAVTAFGMQSTATRQQPLRVTVR
jgi:hypothetical protein